MKFLKYTPIAFIVGSIIACSTPPDYPPEPFLEFVSLSKDTLQRGDNDEDETEVTLAFTDGDGDISVLDTNNLFVVDTRSGVTEGNFTIPDIPVVGTANGIKGEIIFTLRTTCCDFPPELGELAGCDDEHPDFLFDKVIYEAHVVDRAGHKSNIVELAPVYIRCYE